MNSIFKDIPGFPNHRVSSEGEVLCISTGRISKGCITKYGYRVISSGIGGKTKQIFVHRAVYLCFVGEIPEGLDGNKENNSLSNLEAVTYQKNSIHAVQNKLQPNVFSLEEVSRIVEMYKSGVKSWDIAKEFNTSPRNITSVLSGTSYLHSSGGRITSGKAKGDRIFTAKLNDEKVIEIKIRLKNGESLESISKRYGVGKTNIHKISQGLIWKHIS